MGKYDRTSDSRSGYNNEIILSKQQIKDLANLFTKFPLSSDRGTGKYKKKNSYPDGGDRAYGVFRNTLTKQDDQDIIVNCGGNILLPREFHFSGINVQGLKELTRIMEPTGNLIDIQKGESNGK